MRNAVLKRDSLPERVSTEILHRQRSYFAEASITRHLLDALPSILVILNQQRQIVFANQRLLDLIGEEEPYGLRPGEALQCTHAQGEGGCGTSEACGACGMFSAILISLAGRREDRECRFLRTREGRTEAIDLFASATPLSFCGEGFTVFALTDISHEKRRRALERIFFHDLLNVIGSIRGFSEILQDYDPADRQDIYAMIQGAAEQMIDEIEAQRTLAAAESKELVLRPVPVAIPHLLEQLGRLYQQHEVARERTIRIDTPVPEEVVVTDRMLLARILGNMLKNALEATGPGQVVTLGCRRRQARIEFRVHNPAEIPAEIQHEIFQRSFSTKGPGRGLGTYSMKILSEYLGADLSFASSQEQGTTFRLVLPDAPPSP